MVEFIVGISVDAQTPEKALERLKSFLLNSGGDIQYSYIQDPDNGHILEESVVIDHGISE